MIITGADSQAVISAVGYLCLFGFLVGLFLASLIYLLYRKILRQIKFPNRVKTEEGFLYRTEKGLYVKKNLVEEHDLAFELKIRQRSIAFHERRLVCLKKVE